MLDHWFERWGRNRPWATSEWGQAWEKFVQMGNSRFVPEYRAEYEKAEVERRAREHD